MKTSKRIEIIKQYLAAFKHWTLQSDGLAGYEASHGPDIEFLLATLAEKEEENARLRSHLEQIKYSTISYRAGDGDNRTVEQFMSDVQDMTEEALERDLDNDIS